MENEKPIEPKFHKMMNDLAKELDLRFNPEGERKIGFVLLTYPHNSIEGRTNYISNSNREDVCLSMVEFLKRAGN